MPWNETKRVKIKLLKENPRAQDIVAEFEIDEAHRTSFQTTLEYFLAALVNAECTIEKLEDTIDGETKEAVALEIRVRGFQQKMNEVLQQHSGVLRQSSLRSR